MHAFIAELRRRNVLRIAAFYAAAGWLLVQVATQVFPFFDIPNGVVRIVVIVIALGLPVALIFAWVYELTPQGLKLESEVAADASITRHTGRVLDRWIIAVLGLAVALLLADKLVLRKSSSAPSQGVVEAPAAIDKSIAVLPFENLSDDRANAFFASGIQDEIITRLAKIGALKVISRTSTQHYSSSPDNLPEIARQLGVGQILEGSVQKVGDTVHVNVQLIRAATDEHLWAESYNRKLDDIFGVEGEVAQAVAEALNAKLKPAEQQALIARPTDDPLAYEDYLRGRAVSDAGYSFFAAMHAIDAFKDAVQRDPQFVIAWAQLSYNMSVLYFDGVDAGRSTAAAVRASAETALRLAPQSGEALLAHAFYLYRVERDYPGALEDFRRALEKLPHDPQVLQGMFLVERRMGRWDDALAHAREAVRRDPRNFTVLARLGCEGLNFLRRFDEAREVLRQALTITPDEPNALACLAAIEQAQGRLDAAQAWLPRTPIRLNDVESAPLILQRLYRRQFEAAIALIAPALPDDDARLTGPDVQNLVFLGYAQKWAGQADAARRSFQRAVYGLEQSADAMEHTEIVGHHTLALAYAGLAERDAAVQAAKLGVEYTRFDAIKRAFAEIAQAQVYAQLHDADAAIALLPHLLETPVGLTPALLALDPIWDPIRGDPRFRKLSGEAGNAKP